MLLKGSGVNSALKKLGDDAPQKDKQKVVDDFIQLEFENMKAKRCTHEFSAPPFAEEAFEIMTKDSLNFAGLSLMMKIPKLNPEAKPVLSKATGKPMMQWVVYDEDKVMVA